MSQEVLNENIDKKTIRFEISKSIKENKWIDIEYKNFKGEITKFWAYIIDINPKTYKLKCKIFNYYKSIYSKIVEIKFDEILSAKTLDLTTSNLNNDTLVKKINDNIEDFLFLDFNRYDYSILNYYYECYLFDIDPKIDNDYLIEGIDVDILNEYHKFKLNPEQIKKIVNNIDVEDKENIVEIQKLVISRLIIEKNNKKYLLAYQKLLFDPSIQCLLVNKDVEFNTSLLIEDTKYSLYQYLDEVEVNEFMDLYVEDNIKGTNFLKEKVDKYTTISTLPTLSSLKISFDLKLEKLFHKIQKDYENNKLSTPLKAFFGDLTKASYKRSKEPSIMIYDDKININQMRVLYNAMKYPLTYVQGPPGTGKSQTILNVILSALFNNKKILVCSGNNKPVESLVSKLKLTYLKSRYNLPYLRLGSFKENQKAVLKLRDYFNLKLPELTLNEEDLDNIRILNDSNNKELVHKLGVYEQKVELENIIRSFKSFNSDLEDNHKLSSLIDEYVLDYLNKFNSLEDVTNQEVIKLTHQVKGDPSLEEYFYNITLKRLKLLQTNKYDSLSQIVFNEDLEEATKKFNDYIYEDDNIKLLTEVFPIILCTNISSYRLGSSNFKFDIVTMDEAGQCNIATSLIPISRAKNLLLVGDPYQLRPIIIIDPKTHLKIKNKYHISDSYDYTFNSILDVYLRNDTISKFIILKYHYRSGKKIINFSNKRYYHNELNLDFVDKDGNIKVKDIKTNNRSYERNSNIDEAINIVKYVKENNLKDVLIVTPFVNQKNLINHLLKENGINDITCGTIHSTQGSEANTIILSTALNFNTSKRTYDWLKDNEEIINVAVTRAKENLIITCDNEILDKLSNKKDDLYTLVEYIKSDGSYEVSEALPKIDLYRSNQSTNESEFLKTLSHFCSCYKDFKAKRGVSFKDIFKDDPKLSKTNYIFDFVLYKKSKIFKKEIPLIAIELDGQEHFNDEERIYCDKIKTSVCKEKGITLLRIPNKDRKCYEEIKALIFNIQKKKDFEQLSLDLDLS